MASIFDDVKNYVSQIPLTAVASIAANSLSPETRRRAAVVAHDAYAAVDGYIEHRPTLFYGGLLVAASGTAMAVQRRRQGPEAVGSWLALAAAGAGVAWITKPTHANTGAPGTPAMATVNKWLDARASYLDQHQPGWQEQSLNRLLG